MKLPVSDPLKIDIALSGFFLYVFAIFIPGFTALGNVGLGISFLVAITNVDRAALRAALMNAPVFVLLLLVLWLFSSTLWSVQPDVTLLAAYKKLKEYFLVAPVLVFLLSNRRSRDWLGFIFALAGIFVAISNLNQYIREYAAGSGIMKDIMMHRDFSIPLIAYIPFSLYCCFVARKNAYRIFWAVTLSIQIIMLFATGARGAWVALFASFIIWLFYSKSAFFRKSALIGFLGLFAISAFILPQEILVNKVRQGADTTLRTTGTWGPALEMSMEKPLLGFGYGNQVFHDEFNKRANERPWSIKQSLGPHSLYLDILFSGGVVGLLLLLTYIILITKRAIEYLGSASVNEEWYLMLAMFSSFVGFYPVRGLVENTRMVLLPVFTLCIMYLYSTLKTSTPDQNVLQNRQ